MKDGYLSSLVGRSVQVYKGGPDSNVGHLLGVYGDYLTLQKENGEIIYYKTSHVKSISENSKVRFNSALVSNLEGTNTVTHELFKGENFTEMALNLKDQKIRINGKGPESRVGRPHNDAGNGTPFASGIERGCEMGAGPDCAECDAAGRVGRRMLGGFGYP